MDETLHKIDDLFYNELEGYKEVPSARSWQEISAQLDEPQKPAAPVFSFPYLRIALILALLVSGFALNKVVVSRKSLVGSRVSTNTGAATTSDASKPIQNSLQHIIPVRKQIDPTSTSSVSKSIQNSEFKTPVRPGHPGGQNSTVVEGSRNKHFDSTSTSLATEPIQNSKFKIQNFPDIPVHHITYSIVSLSASVATKLPQQPIASSQKPLIKVISEKQLSVTAFFSPNFTWSKLTDHEEHRPGGWGGRPHEDHHDISENENPGFSYTTGLKLRLDAGKHLLLETGASFTATNTRQEPKKLYADHDDNGKVQYRLNCSAGYAYMLPESVAIPVVGDSIMMSQSDYNVQYLNLPVLAGYRFGKGKLSTAFIAGPQFNVLLKGKSSAVLQQNTNNKTTVASSIQGLKKLTTDMVAEISLDYRIAPKFSLNLTPQGRFSLSSINQSGAVTSKPAAISLSAGLRYFF